MADQYTRPYAAEFSLQLLRGQLVDSLMSGRYANGISLKEFILGPGDEPALQAAAPAVRDDALTKMVRSDT